MHRQESEPMHRRNQPAGVIARRAVDLALDGRVSLEDGAHHLCHLATNEHTPLDDALRQLPVASAAEPEEECARILLCRALVMLGTSGIADPGSSPVTTPGPRP